MSPQEVTDSQYGTVKRDFDHNVAKQYDLESQKTMGLNSQY